ncbi:Amine oxidase [Pleurostoma richardsiae]|uniref:Amine oxidase n=1 Tax=Pleurostoma richardsiae TaxID=41990 RepID=A0AA38R159_9PEZI|nr:Amine oxidase [Pleurostoma richardsiae]
MAVETLDLDDTASAYFAPATVTAPGSIVYISGQVGITRDGRFPADYKSQIHLALLKLRAALYAANASAIDIAKLTIYVVNYDPAQRKHVEPLKKFLGGHRPAITLVPVPQLAAPGWLFEVEAVVARPSLPRPLQHSSLSTRVDVIIIGAGLAGLAAADKVIQSGLSCIVLEARDRVGGKTWSKELASGDGVVELGAAWINDSNQSRMIELARKFGAELIEQNTTGNCVFQGFDGSCSSFPYGELPRFDAATVENVAKIRDMVEEDCQAVDVSIPRDTALDSLTFEAYLRSRGASHTAISTATLWTRAMLGQEPADISALFFLNYCKSGGGLLQMRSDRKHGGQYLRIRQGTQLVAKGFASTLPGGVLRLSSPVTSVKQVRQRALEVHAAGHVYRARKVICSVPTPVLKSIDFAPPLPLSKRLVTDSTSYGYYTKVMMVFKSAFWVSKGFCGLIQSFAGPAAIIRDTSSPADNKHVLTCFLVGEPGQQWSALSPEERLSKLLEQIGTLFDHIENVNAEFVEMVSYEWTTDEYAGWGCPCASLGPGVLDTVGTALRESVGDMHFVGTETAEEWKGYMEGAVRSGERGAAEVVSDLARLGVVSRL